jgi:hypothetical protein
MAKFTKESFEVISVTDIPYSSLLPGVIKELNGRELMVDTDDELNEKLYSGDVFEAIACEWAELFKADENHRQIFRITQEMIDEVDNLAEIIETELVRIVTI